MKSTAALLLAGGMADDFSGGKKPVHKALLPFRGRPIAGYVIQALHQSKVEKIFVLHDKGADIKAHLDPCTKAVFIEHEEPGVSLGRGIIYGLRKIAEYYGQAEIHEKIIMIVPCDIPLTTMHSFNTLIEKAETKTADVIITIIAKKLLDAAYPKRRFRSTYLAEYHNRYTTQNVTFIHGSFITVKPASGKGQYQVLFGEYTEEMLNRIVESTDALRARRKGKLLLPLLLYELFIVRLVKNGCIMHLVRLFSGMCFRRLTMDKLMTCVNAAFQVKAGYIESEQAEISGDIDRPEDVPVE